ncbi:MAG: enoyl-[acyl-carrier-protein] reductase FabK [Deltaproteobacteria bacterium]|nr:MAG: enoyl-[acyl-carrier-protein] reductase FabK [Deltaproteobacteria bacterium]
MFQTPLCKLLGIKYPIIQGALGSRARPVGDADLVSAVSAAGGLGVLCTWNQPIRRVFKEIEKVRSLTDKPFAVNVAATHSSFDFSKKVKALAEAGVRIVTTGRGDPNIPAISILKDNGIIVIPVVGNIKQAVKVEKKGADAVVASGCEAGGHVGRITTLTLVPQVVDAVKIPVIAAGGIGDARGFVAALALGACGVQMGTRFVVTRESVAAPELKKMILQASSDDTVVTTMRTGWPTRTLKSRFTEEWDRLNKAGASPGELRDFRRMVLKRVKEDARQDTIGAGQICGMLHDLKGAKEVIEEMIKDACEIVSGLENTKLDRSP